MDLKESYYAGWRIYTALDGTVVQLDKMSPVEIEHLNHLNNIGDLNHEHNKHNN